MSNQRCDLFADAKHMGDDLSAFNYLASGIVDVAFVNLKIIENKTEAGELSRFNYFLRIAFLGANAFWCRRWFLLREDRQ